MIRLPQKDNYTIGIMTGSFYTDYSRMMADAISKGLAKEDVNVDVFLFQGLDAARYLSLAEDASESFDRHYYSTYEYAKYIRPDLLIISFGTISAVKKPLSVREFLAPFGDVPVILIEDDTEIENGISITVDNYHGMHDCVEHLIRDHGCKRILFVAGPKNVPDSVQRLAAYRDALNDNGLRIDEHMIAYGDFTDRVDERISALLARTPNADAVCCANDEMAESAYRVLISRGLYPGRDIAVTGFDDNAGARYMNPTLTTVRQDFGRVAEEVVNTLHRLLQGEEAVSAVIGAPVIRRNSCGCLESVTRDEGASQEADNRKVIEDRLQIKSLQNKIIVSPLLLRGLIATNADRRTAFSRLGKMLEEIGTRRSFLYLLDDAPSLDGSAKYFLPAGLRLYLSQTGKEIAAYAKEDAPFADTAEIARQLAGVTAREKQMAAFPLFCGNTHYGVLFVELNRNEMLFYYTLSLEIGTGLRYLQTAEDAGKAQEKREDAQ